jgi:hypothetical protein
MRRFAVVVLALGLMAAAASCGRGATEVESLVTIYIGAEQADCIALNPRRCLLVRESPDGPWLLFYDEIEGFSWEPGYEYTLLVARRTIRNPPADGSSIAYRLVEILARTRA